MQNRKIIRQVNIGDMVSFSDIGINLLKILSGLGINAKKGVEYTVTSTVGNVYSAYNECVYEPELKKLVWKPTEKIVITHQLILLKEFPNMSSFSSGLLDLSIEIVPEQQ